MRSFCTLLFPLAAALLTSACYHAPEMPADPGPPFPIVEHVARQEILTPLPLRVRLPERYGVDRVLVFVHTWGSRDWSTLDLDRVGQTWSGEVSCRAVSTVTGETRYFFLALNGDGQIIMQSGSPSWPHVATIVGALPDGPQALPGEAIPIRCHDPADCPPDFPGCPAYALLRPPCDDNAECAEGGRCAWDGYCDPPPVSLDPAADEDALLLAAIHRATGRNLAAADVSTVRR